MNNESFDEDAPERTSSGAGVKALRERLEQQNREVRARCLTTYMSTHHRTVLT